MNYRIRYRQGEPWREAEVVVEAHSPNEAMVKFQCTRQVAAATKRTERREVTSVCPADMSDSLAY